jgi:hypothetical protein
MTIRGHIENGVVVLDEPANVPDGTVVRVEIVESKPRKTLAERFANIIGAANDLPSDMAAQHDHYIHGTPKK